MFKQQPILDPLSLLHSLFNNTGRRVGSVGSVARVARVGRHLHTTSKLGSFSQIT